ncbi:MAG: response regulator, partial [Candidatus Eremiobacteraeota bacterium]|nr:response regulator [Candidatus Eremiobacteraeota bacterium]
FARPRAVGSTPRILSAGVLVFSEDDTFTEIVTRYATAWGMTARRVASARAARSAIDVRSAHATRGWVAIIDGSGQRGAAVAAELRALRAFDALPTIVVGPDERLSEPLRASELFDAIVDALAGSDASTSNRTLEHEARQPPRGRVLVAEDNVTMHEVLVHQFDALGVGLKIVSDGAQAVAEVRRDPYDLVLMDCQMPKVDGFEATRLIREDERVTGRHVPIVAMTANAFKEDRDACLAAGMDDYLAKPVRMETLRATLDRWLQRKAD